MKRSREQINKFKNNNPCLRVFRYMGTVWNFSPLGKTYKWIWPFLNPQESLILHFSSLSLYWISDEILFSLLRSNYTSSMFILLFSPFIELLFLFWWSLNDQLFPNSLLLLHGCINSFYFLRLIRISEVHFLFFIYFSKDYP